MGSIFNPKDNTAMESLMVLKDKVHPPLRGACGALPPKFRINNRISVSHLWHTWY